MDVFEGLDALPPPERPATVAIGVFDGVHLGHRAIVDVAIEDARRHSRPALVFTFDRHPEEVVAPDRAPDYLTTPAQRNRAIADLGVDGLVIAQFDTAFSQLTPDAFAASVLKKRLRVECIVVGSNFRFGQGRAGDLTFLQGAQSKYGFQVVALDPITIDGAPVSSTRIRDLLRAGDFAAAEALLGRPYLLAGAVTTGRRLGRTLGYPTANVALAVRQVVPPDGIYAVRVWLEDGRELGGACSIGERPTIVGAGRAIEIYLLDFDEDIYESGLEVRFVAKLRAEEKFESLETLTRQIASDVENAREALRGA